MGFAVSEPEVERIVSVRRDVIETNGGRMKMEKEHGQEKNPGTESGLDNSGRVNKENLSTKRLMFMWQRMGRLHVV
jgi:hypothetical protein